MISAELALKIEDWRRKAIAGTLTPEECREAIQILRQGRTGAQITSTASKTKKATAKAEANIDVNQLFMDLTKPKE